MQRDRWVCVGTVRVDCGRVIVASASVEDGVAAAVDKGVQVDSPIGVDLRPLTGLPAVVVPSGYGDGDYPVYVRLVTCEDGVERVGELSVRFMGSPQA